MKPMVRAKSGLIIPGNAARYRRNAARNRFKFAGVDDVLEDIRQSDPTYDYVNKTTRDKGGLYPAGAVTWTGTPGYLTQIPVKNVLFMEGNIWYPGHGAALLKFIQNTEEPVFEAPPARVYRVTAKLRKDTEKYNRDNELEYQTGLVEPWRQDEQGEYYAQLMDGNHRAAAAILAGDSFIYVYVLPNTRENVYKKDLV